MPELNVTRYRQGPNRCAVASCATLANYYNKEYDYQTVKKFIKEKKIIKDVQEGLLSGEIIILLNNLGFHSVTMVSTNMDYLDYSWAKLGKNILIKKLRTTKEVDYKMIAKCLASTKFNNNLIIDYKFGDYIRGSLSKKCPVLLSFNWTMFFQRPKENNESEDHAVVVYGYDKAGVSICDSHYQYRKQKFKRGYYHMTWEHLMTTMGQGDLFIPMEYDQSKI